MFKTILAYILAFIFLGWISGLVSALFLPVMIAKLGRDQLSLRSVPDDHDPDAVVRMEYGYLIGDLIGLIGALLTRGQLPSY